TVDGDEHHAALTALEPQVLVVAVVHGRLPGHILPRRAPASSRASRSVPAGDGPVNDFRAPSVQPRGSHPRARPQQGGSHDTCTAYDRSGRGRAPAGRHRGDDAGAAAVRRHLDPGPRAEPVPGARRRSQAQGAGRGAARDAEAAAHREASRRAERRQHQGDALDGARQSRPLVQPVVRRRRLGADGAGPRGSTTVTRATLGGDRLVTTSTTTRPGKDGGEAKTFSRESTWTLSPDGRTLTIDTVMHTPRGDKTMRTVYLKS